MERSPYLTQTALFTIASIVGSRIYPKLLLREGFALGLLNGLAVSYFAPTDDTISTRMVKTIVAVALSTVGLTYIAPKLTGKISPHWNLRSTTTLALYGLAIHVLHSYATYKKPKAPPIERLYKNATKAINEFYNENQALKHLRADAQKTLISLNDLSERVESTSPTNKKLTFTHSTSTTQATEENGEQFQYCGETDSIILSAVLSGINSEDQEIKPLLSHLCVIFSKYGFCEVLDSRETAYQVLYGDARTEATNKTESLNYIDHFKQFFKKVHEEAPPLSHVEGVISCIDKKAGIVYTATVGVTTEAIIFRKSSDTESPLLPIPVSHNRKEKIRGIISSLSKPQDRSKLMQTMTTSFANANLQKPKVTAQAFNEGDTLILRSEGHAKLVTLKQIMATISSEPTEQSLAERLTQLSVGKQSEDAMDNVTVIAIEGKAKSSQS